MSRLDLVGRHAFVTGGTRGIGLACAIALAKAGADVSIVGRNSEDLVRAASMIRETGRSVFAEVMDLANTQEIRKRFDSWQRRVGGFDILINSAGVNLRGSALDLTLEDWEEVLSLNLTATWELSRCFARTLIDSRRKGRVINIASLMSFAARPGVSAYTASKRGNCATYQNLAVEWAGSGILVNAVAPGYIDTELNKSLVADPTFDKWVKTRCPLGRWGTTEDIAGPVVFLAGEAANFITGQVIYVDGGWTAAL